MKKKNEADDDRAYEQLKQRLGLDKDVSPDQLRGALKDMVQRKVIADYKIKKE